MCAQENVHFHAHVQYYGPSLTNIGVTFTYFSETTQ